MLRRFAAPRCFPDCIGCGLVLLFLALSPCIANAGEPLRDAGAIRLPGVVGRLDHLAFDARSGRLFVAALENQSVEVLDLTRQRHLHQITGIREPQGLLCVPVANRLLVCSRGDGTCRSFDATTFTEGPWLDVGRNADNLRYDPDSRLIFICSAGEPGNGLLTAVDFSAFLPVALGGQASPPHSPADFLLDRPRQAEPRMEIPLSSHPESLQWDAARRRLYVNVPDEHHISVLQVGTNALEKVADWPVTIGEKNFPMVLDSTSNRLFIACRKPARLAIYDLQSGALQGQVPCVGDADDLYFDTRLQRVYVIGGEGFVDVFQMNSNNPGPVLLARLPTLPRARTGLFLPELELLAVAVPHTTNGPASVRLYRTQK